MKISIICTLIALSTITFECALASEQNSVNLTCDDFMSQNHILRELSVKAGDSFTVTLCANPTTGFQWESAVISDPSVLAETSHQFFSPKDENLVGAAGRDVWSFQALKQGTITISTAYSRPWEDSKKGAWSFTAVVTVK